MIRYPINLEPLKQSLSVFGHQGFSRAILTPALALSLLGWSGCAPVDQDQDESSADASKDEPEGSPESDPSKDEDPSSKSKGEDSEKKDSPKKSEDSESEKEPDPEDEGSSSSTTGEEDSTSETGTDSTSESTQDSSTSDSTKSGSTKDDATGDGTGYPENDRDCDKVAWGQKKGSLNVGAAVPRQEVMGYYDSDGDNRVERDELKTVGTCAMHLTGRKCGLIVVGRKG